MENEYAYVISVIYFKPRNMSINKGANIVQNICIPCSLISTSTRTSLTLVESSSVVCLPSRSVIATTDTVSKEWTSTQPGIRVLLNVILAGFLGCLSLAFYVYQN